MGHNVVFPNGGPSGVVVTHRPPIIFVYFDDFQMEEVEKAGGTSSSSPRRNCLKMWLGSSYFCEGAFS